MRILEEVDKIISGERQDTYGNPEDSFAIIGSFWSVYLHYRYSFEHEIKPEDVAIMMSLFKHARMLGQKYSRDNIVDAVGYLAILADRLMQDKTLVNVRTLGEIDEVVNIKIKGTPHY